MAQQRARRPLDMMPLLDIFMVVLFVFATIQEGKLDATTEQTEKLQDDLEKATARVAQLEQALDEADVETTQSALDEAEAQNQTLSAALDEAREQSESLETKERETKEKLDEVQQKLHEQLMATFTSEENVRKAEILEKLLDQHSVFEIEIRGQADPTLGIINLCCYRSDPRSNDWRSCGQVPAASDALLDWFRQGGSGLERTLRATKGGNAMTIIRHDASATHRIGQKLEAMIRDQVPEQRVYDEGIAVIEMACTP